MLPTSYIPQCHDDGSTFIDYIIWYNLVYVKRHFYKVKEKVRCANMYR